jgi:hypothetical protein
MTATAIPRTVGAHAAHTSGGVGTTVVADTAAGTDAHGWPAVIASLPRDRRRADRPSLTTGRRRGGPPADEPDSGVRETTQTGVWGTDRDRFTYATSVGGDE